MIRVMTVDTYCCPSCGSEVEVGASCPGCKPRKDPAPEKKRRADRKPWQTDGSADGLDLPDEDFDYDEFVAREFGGKPHRRIGIKWYWWVTALVLLVLGIRALM